MREGEEGRGGHRVCSERERQSPDQFGSLHFEAIQCFMILVLQIRRGRGVCGTICKEFQSLFWCHFRQVQNNFSLSVLMP